MGLPNAECQMPNGQAGADQLLPLFIRLHGALRFMQAQLREVKASAERQKIDPEKLAAWASRNDREIQKLFQEFDMGQVATVINGLLGEITTLQGQVSAAQQNSLDTSDTAAISAAQNELTAWQQSQSSASGSGSSASGSSGSGSSGSGSAASGS